MGWGFAHHSVAAALAVKDDSGATIRLPRSPQRIVSLLPSLTETVCALNQCQRLVGVDRYSNYPPNVRTLPRVGGGMDPNIEAIVALRPDVVLAATSSRIGARLTALGIPVLSLEPQSHADVKRALITLGQLLEVQNAEQVWTTMDAAVSVAARSLAAPSRGTRVYFEVNSGPYAAGEASFIGETLGRLGLRNIVPADLGAFPKLNPEFVVRADPDLIMIGDASLEGMQQRPGWPQMRALREQRVCVFNPEESDILVRPGPRLAEAAALMVRCVNAMATKGKAP
jgi:iron complex transport system substrate-binding protein